MSFKAARDRAVFLRFAADLRRAARKAAEQLGHREREAVYQRAIAAELSLKYTCELEYPVPVRFATSGGSVVTLAHERADIVVNPLRGSPRVVVVEIKRGNQHTLLREGMEQAKRYATHIARTVQVAGTCTVVFDRAGKHPPKTASAQR